MEGQEAVYKHLAAQLIVVETYIYPDTLNHTQELPQQALTKPRGEGEPLMAF